MEKNESLPAGLQKTHVHSLDMVADPLWLLSGEWTEFTLVCCNDVH